MNKKLILITTLCLFSSVSWSQYKVSVEQCIKGNCKNGQSTYAWANGDKYVGEFKDGNRTGQGTYAWANGDKYVGEFKDGKIEGQGTFTFASGNKYEGEFKDGNFNGQGTMTSANGDIINSGIWENDIFLKTKEEEERERISRIDEYIQQEEEVKKKYDRIYNACLLDKSSGVDLEISNIKTAVEKTCESIAENPSWLESLRYNYWQKMFGN